MQDVALKHQIAIAKRTLGLTEIGARIMGGMNHEQAREVLRQAGWSDQRIERHEGLA